MQNPCQIHAKSMPNPCQSHAKSMPMSCQSHAKVMPKSCQSHAKVMPKSCQSHARVCQSVPEDARLEIVKEDRAQVLKWGQEAYRCMTTSQYPCIQGFFQAWSDFKTNFHFRPTDTHNNLLHSPIFFNPSH